PTTSSTQSRTICSNQLPYTWDGQTFTAAGQKVKTGLLNQYGCDSTATYNLSVNPTTSSTQSRTICSNQLPYIWDGQTFTAAGQKVKTGLLNQYGCDSTATYNLSVNPTTSSTQSRTICSNQLPYTWDGQTFTAAGQKVKTGLLNQYGCDSTATYNLTVNPTTSSTQSRTICSNQLPYTWDGQTFTAAGQKVKTGLLNQYGCDSTATYNLTVNPTTSSTQSRTICSNQLPYTWDGQTFTAAGQKVKTGLLNQYGCDSTATYNLSVNPTTSSTQSRTICSNQLPYTWDGLTFDGAGTKTKTGL
ncbi:hypothetical protein, partial [Lacibacter luteus]|uniref:hypothetical protein n=1 Tax=Lacibacter luteus TaxID=2508719 RepID=UPI00197C19A5